MTTTTEPTSTEPTTIEAAPVATEPSPDGTGVVVHVPPAQLLVDLNIRVARLSRPFVASIREHGVLVPVVAVRTPEGQLRGRYGHRRVLAALEVPGRPTVPVYVAGAENDDTAARVIGQWSENEHRSALSTAERIGAVEQLTLLGLSAGQIARRTKASKTDVTHALHAAASDVARAAADRYEFLTLDQSAALAEFDQPVADDGTGGRDGEAITALVAAAKLGPVEFDHALTAAREAAADRAARASVEAELVAAGVAIIDRPSWTSTARPLHRLTHDGQTLTVEAHAACPGRVAWLEPDWTWTGPGEPDEDDQDNWTRTYLANHCCADPATHGHVDQWATPIRTGGAARQTATTSDDDQTAAAEDAAAEAEREAKRAERRTVIANNKAMDAAAPIRRAWLRTQLGRKTAPKGAAAFLATSLASGDYRGSVGTADSHALAVDLLGLAEGTDLTVAAEQASEARATVIALAVALAGYEVQVTRDAWRSPWRSHRAYFGWIGAHGYTLSDVEALASGAKPNRRAKTSKTAATATTQPDAPADVAPVEQGDDSADGTATDSAAATEGRGVEQVEVAA